MRKQRWVIIGLGVVVAAGLAVAAWLFGLQGVEVASWLAGVAGLVVAIAAIVLSRPAAGPQPIEGSPTAGRPTTEASAPARTSPSGDMSPAAEAPSVAKTPATGASPAVEASPAAEPAPARSVNASGKRSVAIGGDNSGIISTGDDATNILHK